MDSEIGLLLIILAQPAVRASPLHSRTMDRKLSCVFLEPVLDY